MNWSDWVAIYAAIVATSAVVWEIVAWWLGQARIEVEVFEVFSLDAKEKDPEFCIKAINKGDKHIVLHKFMLEAKDGQYLFIPSPVHKLEGRNCHSVYVRKQDVIKHVKDPVIAWVTDAVGNKYHSKPYKMKGGKQNA